MSRSLALDPAALSIIDAEIASGRFSRPEDVVAAGLDLLESRPAEREAAIRHLNRLIREGLESPIVGAADEVFAELLNERPRGG